ncbi:CIC family chloride channel protein [Mucilaginibacter gracilis]|uniref:CIC family chloride channel protein n=1 Tax=Mucilaginibacter gracilis TaxID=423350 RepID=A0A495J043_9SPHI|nr:chloride channel protein [Mucilaginibacter gracilis]RKR82346.1 CIC family chloride channel protein [Mucilaginibacter gracilis]
MFKSIFLAINNWRLTRNGQKNFLLYGSAVVGLIGGLAAVLLKYLVHLMEDVSLNISGHLFHILYIFLPAVGILLTVAYQHLINRDKIEKGIGSVLANVKTNRSNIAFNNIYSHLITSSLTVGFGGSSGLEAPIVCTGAAIGSNTGQFFRLSPFEKTVLLASGSAAGIAAVFNSPIAGVLFAIEILIGEISIPTFIPLLIASATGVVVAKVLYSRQLFHLVTEGWVMAAIPFYILLGLLSGLVTVYIAKVGGGLEKGILKNYNRYQRAIAGGLMLGLLILIFPPLLGEGYHYMQEVLNGNIDALKEQSLFPDLLSQPLVMILFIASLVFVKIIAAGITIGSGGNGGTFAPSMFTGAFLGLLVAFTVNQTGLIHLNTSNFIAVGMAGAISGVMHAPLTAIFLIAEITGGYILFIPLMIVSAMSYIISRAFNPHNMYWHHLITEKNIHPGADHSMLDAISLKSMVNNEYAVINKDTTLKMLFKLVAETTTSIFAVLSTEGKLEGIVFLSDVRKYMFSVADENMPVADVMVIPPAIINDNESISYVMDVFDTYGVWHLPVVKNGLFIGFISKSALFVRYREVMLKQHKEADIFAPREEVK